MLADSTLLAIQGLPANRPLQQTASAPVSVPAFPSAVAIDLAPGASDKALAARISDAGPGGTPGGTYQLPANRIRGAAIVDAAQMGSQPLILALALAAGAVLSLALALLTSVRQRRRELALLKTLGLTRRQVMAAVAWQASVILVIAALIGVPLGRPPPLGVGRLRHPPGRRPGNRGAGPGPAGRDRGPAGSGPGRRPVRSPPGPRPQPSSAPSKPPCTPVPGERSPPACPATASPDRGPSGAQALGL